MSKFNLLRETGVSILTVCVSPNAFRYTGERVLRRLKELANTGQNLQWLKDNTHLDKTFQAFREALARGDEIVILGDDPPLRKPKPERKVVIELGAGVRSIRYNIVKILQDEASEARPMTKADIASAIMELNDEDASVIRERVEKEVVVELKNRGYDLRSNVRGYWMPKPKRKGDER